MKRELILFLLVLFLIQQEAVPQDIPPILSLREAVAASMRVNPEILKLQAALEGKAIEWKTAIGLSAPEIVYAREGISAIEPLPFAEQRFVVNQEFDFPLLTFYRLKRILKEKEALEQQLEALRRDVTVRVKSNYAEILFADQIRLLRADNYRMLQDFSEAVRSRDDTTSISEIDRLSSEIRLIQAENDQFEAERVYHESRYRLFNSMGLNPENQRYDIRMADTLITKNELIEQELTLYTLDLQPLYKSASALLAASEIGIREARSGYLPNGRISYMAQDFGTGYRFRGFEAGLQIPLWGFLTVNGNVGLAKSSRDQLLWDQKIVELSIKQKIEMAWHSYDKSQATIQLFETQLKDKSEKLLRLSREAYRKGQIDLLKFIEAQQLYLASQEAYQTARRDYYLRLIEMEQYVGQELVY